MVTTLSPNAKDTPTRPIPTSGKPAAMTALPHPAKVSQNVPIASAVYFFVFITRLPRVLRSRMLGRAREGLVICGNRDRIGRIPPIFVAFPDPKPPSPVDIGGFVCYMPALRVEDQAFRRPFTLPEFL